MTPAAAAIKARVPGLAPRLAIILGSGLGGLAELVTGATVIPYKEIPGFPAGALEGHRRRMVIGRLGGVPVVCLEGRVHYFEGGGAETLRNIVRTIKSLGCETLFLTNAAGSLRQDVGPGSLVAISDHINFQPFNPLVGPNDDTVGPRFPSMRDAYDPALRARLQRAAGELGVRLHEGVYIAYSGPNFETPAEIRAFRVLGADVVGMSTVPEAILARHCGLTVAAVSVITNLAEGLAERPLSHEQTLAEASAAAATLSKLILRFLEGLAKGG